LRDILGEVIWVITHTKDTYLSAFYQRIVDDAARRPWWPSPIVYYFFLFHVLRNKKPCFDLDYLLHQVAYDRLRRYHMHQLEQLGYTVTLTPKAAV